MTQRWANVGRHSLRHGLLLALLAGLVLAAPVLTAQGQEERVAETILHTVALLPENDLPSLVQLAVALNLTADLHPALMDAPRAFLEMQAVTDPIVLASNAFQITAIDFSVDPESTEDPWFGFAEPLDGLVFEPKGLGIFYRNVGIFVQEAHKPLDGDTPGTMAARVGTPTQQVEDVYALIARLTPDALEALRTAMKNLDSLPADASERTLFLLNPREYLYGRGLTLPASTYRIVALDFERASAVDAVKADHIRAGLVVIPEGIGVFGTEVGIFLQLAI